MTTTHITLLSSTLAFILAYVVMYYEHPSK